MIVLRQIINLEGLLLHRFYRKNNNNNVHLNLVHIHKSNVQRQPNNAKLKNLPKNNNKSNKYTLKILFKT